MTGQKVDFANVLAEHGAMLGRIAAIYEARAAQRQDLLQEIALALWRALPGWRADAALKTFVARIAHNRGVNHVLAQRRNHGIDMPDELPDEHADPHHLAAQRERQMRLAAAVRRLPLGQRQAVAMALEGFSHAEIAETLGTSVNTIDVRMHRARQTLQQQLKEAP